MKNIESIQDLLEQEVSRREFLLHVGAAFVAIIGVSSLIKNIVSSSPTFKPKPTNVESGGGYGWSGYSGLSSPASAKTSYTK